MSSLSSSLARPPSSPSLPRCSDDKVKDAVRATCGDDIDDELLAELVGTLQSNELPHEFQQALSLVVKASDSMHGAVASPSPSPQSERRVTRSMLRSGSSKTLLSSPTPAALTTASVRDFSVSSLVSKPIEWVSSLIRGSNKEGAVLRIGDYTNLDAGWSEALVYWLKNYRHYPLLTFPNTPASVAIESRVRFGIVGDWGTGVFGDASTCPFLLVKKQLEDGAYDITIHLGDVYYAGTEQEERENFVNHWPVGSKGSFTLNSNHEVCGERERERERELSSKPKRWIECCRQPPVIDRVSLGLPSTTHCSPALPLPSRCMSAVVATLTSLWPTPSSTSNKGRRSLRSTTTTGSSLASTRPSPPTRRTSS